jgi:hypothetical protein
LATVNAIAKREFDKNLPEAGQISEEIYYNNDASDFIYGGV